MRLAITLTPPTDQFFRWASQIGVDDYVARYPAANSYETLLTTRDRAASFGLRLSVVEGYIPIEDIVHGGIARDDQIDNFKKLLTNMGQLNVPVLCYNFMQSCDWTRTSLKVPARGGALTNGFDESLLQAPPGTAAVSSTGEQLWDNLQYFLDRVLPVAEDAGVTLAMHPDDPPLSTLLGNDQIMHQPEHFERLLNLSDSPANSLCFCQGTMAELGVDIPATIDRLGPRISYVHFRDVQGTVPKFEETFHDNGKTDMAAAMRAYHRTGFSGPMRPDHVPTMDGEDGDGGGYTMLGRLFAVGYMRGLMHAVQSAAS